MPNVSSDLRQSNAALDQHLGFQFTVFWRIFRFTTVFLSAVSLSAQLLETSYQINLKFSETPPTIYVRETVRIVNRSNLALDTIYFHLSPNGFRNPRSASYQKYENLLEEPVIMDIQKIQADSTICEHFDNERLCMGVRLPEKLSPNDSTTISIDFSVKVPRGRHFQCPTYSGTTYRLIRFYPVLEQLTSTGWNKKLYRHLAPSSSFPCHYNLSIELPAKYKVISSLLESSTETVAESKTKLHNFEAASIQELAVVFSGSYKLLSTTHSKIPVRLLLPPAEEKSANTTRSKILANLITDIIDQYANLYCPYPHQQLAVSVAKIPNGLVTSNLIILNQHQYNNLFTIDYVSIYNLAQALARQYFSFYVYENSAQPDWINESLANQAAAIYMAQHYSKLRRRYRVSEHQEVNYAQLALRLSALTADQEQTNRTLLSSSPMGDAPLLMEQVKNFKGQKILDMLAYYIGDSLFQVCIHEFLIRYQHRPVSSAEFLQLVEEISNRDLTAFRKLWLESDEIPDIKIQQVSKSFDKATDTYAAQVIAKGNALSTLPVEVIAINSRSDTLHQFTQLRENGIDTLYFTTRAPIRKISLDPQRNIWEFNRLNNHYPYKILFSFLIGIPRIDAYQVFYYPTFDFNKRDISRIGIKFRGRYWINMRPLFPAQSLDEWTLGFNYGIQSKTTGYDISYSTSLLALFFKPRLHFRSRDYFGLNETTVSTEIYLGEIRYPLLHQIQGYKKLNLALHYENIYTLKFLNANNWQKGKLLNPSLIFVNFHNWGGYRHILQLSLSGGLPILSTDYQFGKLTLDGQLKIRSTANSWVYERIFIGASSGTIPIQQYYYFFGKNVLENLSFESYRLVKGAGDMRGYGDVLLRDRNIITSNTEFRYSLARVDPAVFDLILFLDSGILSSNFYKLALNQSKFDAGIGAEFDALEIIMVGIHCPFWVSHPVDDQPKIALRWVLSFDLTL
jgi:hypothetical protein